MSVTGSYFWSRRKQKLQRGEDAVLRMWVNDRKCRRRHLTSRPFTGTWFLPKVHVTVYEASAGRERDV